MLLRLICAVRLAVAVWAGKVIDKDEGFGLKKYLRNSRVTYIFG